MAVNVLKLNRTPGRINPIQTHTLFPYCLYYYPLFYA